MIIKYLILTNGEEIDGGYFTVNDLSTQRKIVRKAKEISALNFLKHRTRETDEGYILSFPGYSLEMLIDIEYKSR
jgi:hypothetical protein